MHSFFEDDDETSDSIAVSGVGNIRSSLKPLSGKIDNGQTVTCSLETSIQFDDDKSSPCQRKSDKDCINV